MKIIDNSPKPLDTRSMGIVDRIRGTIDYGFSWYAELQAHEDAIDVLGRHLDNRFYLLRNVSLPGADIDVPMVLIGPSGVQVPYPITQKGIYRARGEEWLVAGAGQKYRPASPNLMKRAILMAEAVRVALERAGVPPVKIEPALLCVDPGVHVESVRPVVRVVLSDAIDRFAASLMAAQPVLAPETQQKMIALLGRIQKVEAQARPDLFEEAPEEPEKPRVSLPKIPTPNIKTPDLPPALQHLNLTRNQLIVLAVMAGLEIIVLIAFIFFVLVSLQ